MKIHWTYTVIASSFMLLAMLLSACSSRPKKVEAVSVGVPREQLPVLTTYDVTTLISDSGITRYRIEAKQWLMYDKTEHPYQEFPEGIYLEQFDEDLNVEALLKANYAHYNEQEQLWTLRGNVHALNLEGEQFDTQELKWDQQAHRVYSDSNIHITREKSIIEGVGFVSNEQMTKYTILHPTGIFPIKDED